MNMPTPKNPSLRTVRIALVLPAFLPAEEYGGPINKVRALAWGLREIGHDPQIWCADYGPGRTRIAAGWHSIEGTPVRYLRRVLSYRWSPVVPQAALAASRSGVDIGHCFGMWDGLTLFAAMGFRRAGIPYVLEPLGMYPPVVRSIGMKRLFAGLFAGRYLSGAGSLIATSEREAEALRSATRLPVVTRPNPVMIGTSSSTMDLRGDLGLGPDERLVGWLGRISRSKGLDVLVEAVQRLPEVHLAIVGPDDGDGAATALRLAIERTGIGHRVHMLGPLWGPDRNAYLASLDLFVLPSLTENFGNSAVEAAVLGIPVVVSDNVGAAAWLQELGAAAVCSLDPQSLAAAISGAGRRGAPDHARLATANAVRDALSPIGVATEQADIYRAVGSRA